MTGEELDHIALGLSWQKRRYEQIMSDGGFVMPTFIMDPDTDDLIQGTQLQAGMIVLVEENKFKYHFDYAPVTSMDYDRAFRFNRWCEVAHFHNLKNPVFDEAQQTVHFVAIYDDRTKKSISIPAQYYWYVKKDSLPENNSQEIPINPKLI